LPSGTVIRLRCIDGDPVNRSFSQYKALGAERLELVNENGLIQRARYDALIERFATTSGTFVVDSGATALLPFWANIVESQVVCMLREAGRTVYLHVPITGGETLSDTLLGFSAVAAASTESNIVSGSTNTLGPLCAMASV